MNLTRRSFIYLSLAILAAGYMGGETSVVLPRLVHLLNLSPTQAGVLISIRFFGGVASGIVLLILGDRYSFRRLFTVAVGLVLGSALLLPFAESYEGVLAVAAIRGPALTILIATSNGALAGWFHRHPGKWSARIHSLYGLGLIIAPAIGSLALSVDLSWKVVWFIPVVILLPMIYMIGRVPEGREPRGYVPCDDCDDDTDSLEIPEWLLIVGFAGFTVGTEASIVGWTPTYISMASSRLIAPELYSIFIAMGIFLGRRITSRVSVRTGSAWAHEISIGIILVMALLMTIIAGSTPIVAGLLGFAMSAMYPLLIARLGIFALRSNGRLYPVVELAAATGGTLLPLLVGMGSEYSPRLAFPVALLSSSVLLMVFSSLLRRQIKR